MATSIGPVPYDRDGVTAGIMHFGVGNFHRSHQAMFIDRLLRNPETYDEAKSWGICGVGILPGDTGMRDALAGQGLEYTLVERSPDGSTAATRIGSLVEYLYAPDQLDAVLQKLADPATRIVSLTITEGGYNISDDTGEFNILNPAIVADANPGAAPATVFGIITAGLQLRRSRGIAPFTIMSCDNIEENGNVARRSFTAYADLVDSTVASWMAEEVQFPNSMVDRITPVTTDEDRNWVRDHFGVEDAWPVISEDFVQWVLEDHFSVGRPPLEIVGVQVVEDVRPYELMKLRLLNAGHQALAFSGLLAGYQYVHDGAQDPDIAAFLRAYMDREATPTLDPVAGVNLDAYKDRLLERFSNPHVRDTLARLATDASDRIPKFLVPVIRELRARQSPVPLSAFVIAAWARYAELVVTGADLPFADRQQDTIRRRAADLTAEPLGFLRNPDWFGPLAEDEGFLGEYLASLAALRANGLRARIRELLS
ncbi:mannitol dehydrogenase family protein [Microbacterium foliorum]|uniref:mannitol dehydrogenase family protein n=1 Tax=Microbacterium foliorum TaxID=104336 RepID=UPI00099FDC4D|nr:mannitol dehydrogenase family protein [Microbacterium foliorum]AQY01839.1 mannitol dehydrogenase [Microbacterium foliorum]